MFENASETLGDCSITLANGTARNAWVGIHNADGYEIGVVGNTRWWLGSRVHETLPNITAGVIADCLGVDAGDITNLIQKGADADTWAEQEYMGFSFTHNTAAYSYYIGTAPTPPAPTDLVATAGDGQVSIAFTAPSNDGGPAISDYEV